MIRWPGGCFADSYDWRDGIGPRARRPRRTNFVLSMPDVHAHNTFENPRVVQPRNEQVTVTPNGITYRFAPASVTRLQIALD